MTFLLGFACLLVDIGDPASAVLPHIPDIVVPMPALRPRPAAPATAPTRRLAPVEKPRYWIHLTNEPGIRAFGRIENGVAVDILRREPIPGYRAPVPLRTFSASSCANGTCPRP